ncbi:hypothetical protein BRADI_5g03086v3 [Brachypodium distachyon]|uniref:Uncharacterized protein n=1 Tax=Brachypodium distachyon TaxID=15368 RepID=A0A2K2CF58_BRADI|nr:hypothetical protein BRADI_5g03086v3 [Brachypodium distachyon]PNT60666.1 hypothetical protein BRADI_5g03086v3 [Brachypodium distachyon]PNT60667.1 hypothetical protein BRADI_5g03086v3 [Brachypodium distachyon]PNT60668.1 hypothetical protein BRADI_5g03086v3 [Brachypodium distachyon]
MRKKAQTTGAQNKREPAPRRLRYQSCVISGTHRDVITKIKPSHRPPQLTRLRLSRCSAWPRLSQRDYERAGRATCPELPLDALINVFSLPRPERRSSHGEPPRRQALDLAPPLPSCIEYRPRSPATLSILRPSVSPLVTLLFVSIC